jgi:hypothetical protein
MEVSTLWTFGENGLQLMFHGRPVQTRPVIRGSRRALGLSLGCYAFWPVQIKGYSSLDGTLINVSHLHRIQQGEV